MSSPFAPNNPGIGGLDELTSEEEAVIADIASLGTAGQALVTNATADGVEWDDVAASSTEGTDVKSTGVSVGYVLQADGDDTCSWVALAGGGDALTANPLSQFAATTSAQLAGVISDETGTGSLVFSDSPTLVTPALGTPSALVGTNITGTAAGLTVGATTGVEPGADVTDTANVTAAGALMDSEVTNLAQVKAFDSSDYATAAQGATADSALQDITGESINSLSDVTITTPADNEVLAYDGVSDFINQTPAEAGLQAVLSEGAFVDGDKTKLDGIEISADVTDTANVTAAGALMDSEVDADIKTLSLPASTTISAFGATLVDDADAATARTTLGLAAGATAAAEDSSGINTGTATDEFVTADALAGSNLGTRTVQITCFDYTTDTATGDGKGYFHIPASMNGMNLVAVHAEVITAGTTGTTDVQIRNVTQTADMLTTKITIDSTETGSDTAATAAVIDTANDDVATNDLIAIDVDAVSTTAAKGLIVTCEFRLP